MSNNQKNIAFERSRLPQSTRIFSKIALLSKMARKWITKGCQNEAGIHPKCSQGTKGASKFPLGRYGMDFEWILDGCWMHFE